MQRACGHQRGGAGERQWSEGLLFARLPSLECAGGAQEDCQATVRLSANGAFHSWSPHQHDQYEARCCSVAAARSLSWVSMASLPLPAASQLTCCSSTCRPAAGTQVTAACMAGRSAEPLRLHEEASSCTQAKIGCPHCNEQTPSYASGAVPGGRQGPHPCSRGAELRLQ